MNSIKEGFKVGGLKFICSVGAQTRLQLSLQLIHQGIQRGSWSASISSLEWNIERIYQIQNIPNITQ